MIRKIAQLAKGKARRIVGPVALLPVAMIFGSMGVVLLQKSDAAQKVVPTRPVTVQTVRGNSIVPCAPVAPSAPPSAKPGTRGCVAKAPPAVIAPPPVAPPTSGQVPAATHKGGPLRLIFYYPWFPQTWGSDLANPFTNFHPSQGYYSSDNSESVAKHIQAMRYAHMDVAISSWWGQAQQSEQTRFPMQLALAQGTGLSWSLYYEKEGFGNPSVTELGDDLKYIKDRYAGNPNFTVVNGKPTIFVYGDDSDDCGMAERWKQANTQAANSFHIVLKVFAGFRNCAAQPYSWHQYSPAVAADAQQGISYAIGAGFWKKGEQVILARDPNRWTKNVKDMVASQAPMQYVATFNEWGEGTAIEQADEWASPSGYGLYLDALHTHVPSH